MRTECSTSYDSGLPILIEGLSYFRSTDYRLQRGHDPGLFQFADNTTDEDYAYWSKQPGVMDSDSAFVQGYFGWDVERCPFDKVCFKVVDLTRSEHIYVDVGGSKGQIVQATFESYGSLVKVGKVVLQDLGSAVEDVQVSGTLLDCRIDKMVYNYHTPQPVHGPRAYMLENVLHDHKDAVAKEILETIEAALEPGLGKLLILTIILLEQAVPFALCAMDVMANCINGGKERSEAKRRSLLGLCGTQIVEFWFPPAAGNGVVEAELP